VPGGCDDQRGVLIIVRDPGEGFIRGDSTCTVAKNLYSNTGRGIFLINKLMDEVKFNKNGTEITWSSGKVLKCRRKYWPEQNELLAIPSPQFPRPSSSGKVAALRPSTSGQCG